MPRNCNLSTREQYIKQTNLEAVVAQTESQEMAHVADRVGKVLQLVVLEVERGEVGARADLRGDGLEVVVRHV